MLYVYGELFSNPEDGVFNNNIIHQTVICKQSAGVPTEICRTVRSRNWRRVLVISIFWLRKSWKLILSFLNLFYAKNRASI